MATTRNGVAVGRKVFYGWWIVTAGFIIQALNGGIYFYGMSTFFNPLIDEFQWSRTELSGAFSLSRLEAGIAGPIVGFFLDKFGPRRLMVFGISAVAAGFFLVSRVDSLIFFYTVFLLISIGASCGFGGSVNTAVANWFSRKRSLALGITISGVGVGGVGVSGMAWIISVYGWRVGSLAAAAIFLFIALPLTMVMRHKPEQYGYLPDGDIEDTRVESAFRRRDAESQGLSFTPKQALLTTAFWVFSLVFGLRAMITAGIAVHEIPHLIALGYDPAVAASILGAMTMVSVAGRLGFGWMGDRVDKRYVIAGCLALQCIGLYIFANITEFWHVVAFLLIFSPAYGGIIPLIPSTWAHYFGRKSFGTIQGLGQMVQTVGTISGPLIAGYTFDVSGSYQFAFVLFAVLNIPSIFLVMLARKPSWQSSTATA